MSIFSKVRSIVWDWASHSNLREQFDEERTLILSSTKSEIKTEAEELIRQFAVGSGIALDDTCGINEIELQSRQFLRSFFSNYSQLLFPGDNERILDAKFIKRISFHETKFMILGVGMEDEILYGMKLDNKSCEVFCLNFRSPRVMDGDRPIDVVTPSVFHYICIHAASGRSVQRYVAARRNFIEGIKKQTEQLR